jgi:transcriptional regulator with XRE-family HTH domain
MMNNQERIALLGGMLRAERRQRRMTLRELALEIDVSFNTLSRVENGHQPDFKVFKKIIEWLDVPADQFIGWPDEEVTSTPAVIARHLYADGRLTDEQASEIATIVEGMYANLAGTRPLVEVHLRSAKSFTPAAAQLLDEVLSQMQSVLVSMSPK